MECLVSGKGGTRKSREREKKGGHLALALEKEILRIKRKSIISLEQTVIIFLMCFRSVFYFA